MLLDISRTVARSRLPAPTGIDRVERAYIRWAFGRGWLFLAAVDGRQYLLGADAVKYLLGWIDFQNTNLSLDLRGWLQVRRDLKLRIAQSLVRRMAIASAATGGLSAILRRHLPRGGTYVNVGHDNLSREVIANVHSGGLRSTVMIHDTIPVDHPPYARLGTCGRFRAKLIAAMDANLLLANSKHTAGRLAAYGAARAIVAPLGIDPHGPVSPVPPKAFVILGTIEPRKNHLLLLRIWREFWERMGDASPRLIIVGRRGWENAATFRMLDTHPMMGRTVIEAGALGDAQVATHLASAHALLFPSLAEGYGLPLAEALAVGTPVIASDLPAMREVGGTVPEYLPPQEEAAWTTAILSYAAKGSQGRIRQLDRLRHWSAPTWQVHFRIVENALETNLVHAGHER